jgi:Ni,Fe-hydrogenase maturation factor
MAGSGLALFDILSRYPNAINIDVVCLGMKPAGTVREFTPSDLGRVLSPSPPYLGLPETMVMLQEMGLKFPDELEILAMEVMDPHVFGLCLSEQVKKTLDPLVEKVKIQLGIWEGSN